jgi:PAS domain S-box-containing protein
VNWGQILDVTSNNELMASLVDVEELYQNAPCGYFSFLPNGKIIKANRTLLDWLSCTDEEVLLQKKFTDLIARGGAIYYEMIFLPSIKMHGRINEINFDIIRNDGSTFPALINSVAVRDKTQKLLAINATVFDITDRKRYESELLRAKRAADNEKTKFEYLANLIPDIIWTASATGQFDYVNDRFASYFNMDCSYLAAQTLLELVYPDDARKFLRAWTNAIRSGNDLVIQVRLLNQFSNYEWHLIRSIAHKGDDGAVLKWFGSCTNINEQVMALQRKDEFIQIASHELKTPITSLKAYNQLLLRTEVSEKAKNFLRKSASTITNLQFLVSSLLDVTQIDSRQLTIDHAPVSLIEIIEQSIDLVSFSYTSHQILMELSSADKMIVKADKQRLTQVMINLISNAIKYSPGKDSVVIKVNKNEDQSLVRVEVTDFGMGIPPEKIDRIFDKFYRVSDTKNDNKVSGLGLGLYITQNIIKLHGSIIMVSSHVNHGTTFFFSLPLISY